MADTTTVLEYRRADYAPLMSTEQVAGLMQVSGKFVRDMLRAEKLPGVKVGGVWRVNRDALFDLLGLA